MGTQGGIRAGLAFVELYASDNALVKGLNIASAKLKAFGASLRTIGTGLAGLGGAAIAPILASARSFATAGAELEHMAARTGFAVESLSELAGAADLTGTSIEDVENAIKHMQKTVFAASQQNEEAAQALGYLGIVASDLKGMTPEKQFDLIASKLAGIADPGRKAAVAMQILGKNGSAILPLVQNLAAAREEARKMGAVMSTEDAAAGAELAHVFKLLELALRGVYNAIGSAVAPVLTEFFTIAGRVIASTTAWIKKNRDLVVKILEIGAAAVAIGSILLGAGLAISLIGTICGAVAAVITTGFGLATAAVGMFGAVLGVILTPVGLLFVALSAVFAALVYFSGLLGEIADAASSAFESISFFAMDCFGGIKDALMAGDIELAATILWQALKVIWKTGTNALYNVWIEFARISLTVIDLIVGGIARAFDTAANFVYKTWNNVVGWFAKKVGEISATIQNALAYFGIGSTVNVNAQNARIDSHTNADNAAADKGLADRDAAFKRQIGNDQNYGGNEIAQNEAELDKLKADLRGSIFGAHQEAIAAASAPTQKKIDAATPEIDKLVKGTAIGTFNASAAGQLGIGNQVNERIAKAAERTAIAVEGIEKATAGGGVIVS